MHLTIYWFSELSKLLLNEPYGIFYSRLNLLIVEINVYHELKISLIIYGLTDLASSSLQETCAPAFRLAHSETSHTRRLPLWILYNFNVYSNSKSVWKFC